MSSLKQKIQEMKKNAWFRANRPSTFDNKQDVLTVSQVEKIINDICAKVDEAAQQIHALFEPLYKDYNIKPFEKEVLAVLEGEGDKK